MATQDQYHPCQHSVKWQPPAVVTNKENFDGAICKEERRAGLGVVENFNGTICKEEQRAGLGLVIWNGKGEVLVALSQKVPFPHSVEAVEIPRTL